METTGLEALKQQKEVSNEARWSAYCSLANSSQEVARLWGLRAGGCVTVFHMLSRVCVFVRDNVHAHVYVRVCL